MGYSDFEGLTIHAKKDIYVSYRALTHTLAGRTWGNFLESTRKCHWTCFCVVPITHLGKYLATGAPCFVSLLFHGHFAADVYNVTIVVIYSNKAARRQAHPRQWPPHHARRIYLWYRRRVWLTLLVSSPPLACHATHYTRLSHSQPVSQHHSHEYRSPDL